MGRVNKKMALLRQHGYPVDKLTDLLQNDDRTDTIVYTAREFQPQGETFPRDCYAFVGPSLPAGIAETEKKARPLVYISLGTVLHQNPDFYRSCAAALGELDMDVVVSVGAGNDFPGAVPSNFRTAERVDQLAVLSRADAFVTHCGMNSASEAIWFGVPTVLFPQQSEEEAVAGRMEELGLGVRLHSDRPGLLRTAVQAVLTDDGYRTRTARMAGIFRAAGGAERAAAFILSRCK
jgi:MGT family glycosyltransferase